MSEGWVLTRHYLRRLTLCLTITGLIGVTLLCAWLGLRAQNRPKIDRSSPLPQRSFDVNDVFWFVQISDTHINERAVRERSENLAKFLDDVELTIKPRVIFHTGDVTDGRDRKDACCPWTARQVEADFVRYEQIIHDRELHVGLRYIDIRGNHDVFNVPSYESPENLFRKYGVVPQLLPEAGAPAIYGDNAWLRRVTTDKDSLLYNRVREYGISFNGRDYLFVMVDSTPVPGLPLPFNFMAYVPDDLDEELDAYLGELREQYPESALIVLDHFPLTTIQPHAFESVYMKHKVLGRLCGHWHQFKQYFNNAGLIDLEVADFKLKHAYRVLAFDNGLLSFTDATTDNRFVIVITSPKGAAFQSHLEPLQLQATSGVIRVLAFDMQKQQNMTVTAQITFNRDKKPKFLSFDLELVEGNLYQGTWDTTKFARGVHLMEITVTAEDGSRGYQTQEFSLNLVKPYMGTNIVRFLASIPLEYVTTPAIILFLLYILARLLCCQWLLSKFMDLEKLDAEMMVVLADEDRFDDFLVTRLLCFRSTPTDLPSESHELRGWMYKLKRIAWQNLAIEPLARIFLIIITVGLLTLPIAAGNFSTVWGAVFLGYALVGGVSHHIFLEMHRLLIAFIALILLPTVAIHSRRCYEDHCINKGEGRCFHSPIYFSLSSFLAMLCVFITFVVQAMLLFQAFSVSALFLSPATTYAVVCIVLNVRAFWKARKYALHQQQQQTPPVE